MREAIQCGLSSRRRLLAGLTTAGAVGVTAACSKGPIVPYAPKNSPIIVDGSSLIITTRSKADNDTGVNVKSIQHGWLKQVKWVYLNDDKTQVGQSWTLTLGLNLGGEVTITQDEITVTKGLGEFAPKAVNKKIFRYIYQVPLVSEYITTVTLGQVRLPSGSDDAHYVHIDLDKD